MKTPKPLDYQLLRRKLDHAELKFKTTETIKPLTGFIGQERALDALHFGIHINSRGHNLYAMGPTGIGKHSLVMLILQEHAKKMPIPSDWCYIHNFENPEKPIALQLPAGKGIQLQHEMKSFVDELSQSIVIVFESDQYNTGMKKINDFFKTKRAKKRKRTKEVSKSKIPSLYKERHMKEKELEKKLTFEVIEPSINKIKKKFKQYKKVIAYLDNVQKDIIENASDLIIQDNKTDLLTFSMENPALIKYKINLIVDNSKLDHAPIVFEETPTSCNIICRVEHTTDQGTLTTNFNLIKPGALHRANGGYLIIEARKIIKNRVAWDALKNALYSQIIKVDPIRQNTNGINTISLEPEPIPLKVKIILIGSRTTYYNLCQRDYDFSNLFKVPVDFDEQIPRTPKNIMLFARLIGTIVQREKLRPFLTSAVAEIIDFSTRLAEDVEKMSTYFRLIKDLILEANYWASVAKKKTVSDDDVKKAIHAKLHRIDRTREIYYEDINRDFIIINTEGKSIGQVNCLSVRKVGTFSYGHPTRVTARVRLGKGKIIDIQREIKLAGPFHSKASMIISSFIASRFCQHDFFSLSASLSFEQIYCWTDGDSASVGELCALLSALSDIPILQSLAVTGSIDQYGEVQAIGGVNEKIEGFFDICKAKGLNGKQGVIIPAINAKNLMLREDVVEAAKQKKFYVYPINTVDEAIVLLTGLPAGEKDSKGNYPKESVYSKIEKKLQKYANHQKTKSAR